jgi:DNA-binding MarR family transcriptional regulator
MAIAGNLEVFNFIDIFQILKKDKKDGILVVENESRKFAVYFKEGNILYIREVAKIFHIYLDVEFEAVLKKDGIKEEDLYRVLVAKLPLLLAVKKGKFSFTPGFIRYPQDLEPIIPIEKIIMYLSRQLTQEEVERKISDLNLVFEKSDNWKLIAEKAHLTDTEKKILDYIDGEKTVKQIMEEAKVKQLTLQRALYGFLATGLITRKKKVKRKIGFNLTKNLLRKIVERIKGL